MKRGVGIAVVIVISLLFLGIGSHGMYKNGNIDAFPTGKILFVNAEWTPDGENDKYNSIQNAIDNASNGDIIYVFDGTYEENLFIDKSIQLIGENNVMLDGIENHNAIYIITSNIVISNFTVMNGAVSGILINGSLGGHNAVVRNCVLTGNGEEGALLYNTYGNIFVNCTIYSNPVGIREKDSHNNTVLDSEIYNGDWGMIFDNCINSSVERSSIYMNENKSVNMSHSDGISIKNCMLYDNFCGIRIRSSANASVEGCNITGNIVGIRIDGSSNNTVTDCNVFGNTGYGIYISNFGIPSSGNLVHHNNIMGNGENAYDECGNIWNTSVGNYWDDYAGSDTDGDGMGDTPYAIYGGGQDDHPLIYPITTPSFFVWVDDDYNASVPGWQIDHFNSLQNAIDDLKDGGKCYVHPGNYSSCSIDKPITLIGENGAAITSGGDGILINADNVTVSGFSISADDNGIKIQNADNVSIHDCNVAQGIFGLYMVNSLGCNIENSEFYGNMKGIYLFNSSGLRISGNRIHNNSYFGMEISHGSSDNRISDCQIENNGNYGIYITQNSNGNEIYHNNFIGNTAYDACSNEWGSTYEDALGNYWSDYNGADSNRDGMGDTPYAVDGGGMDAYPLVNRIEEPPSFVWVNSAFNETFPGWGVDHFTSIGAAVGAVKEGGGGFVFPGIYAENVVINREVTLSGMSSENTIVDGNFTVTGNDVKIYDFGIRNCWNDAGVNVLGSHAGIFGCDIYDNYYGVSIHAVNATLQGCNIHDNSFTGVTASNMQHSEIKNCSIYGNNNGVMLSYSSYNFIEGNDISGNSVHGLRLQDFSNHNSISYNNFDGNIYGLYAKQSSANDIWLNNFLNNTVHAYDSGVNNWDSGGVGNYWGGYTVGDNNFDGIGDSPYSIPGGTNVDRYPLIRLAGLPVAYFTFIPSGGIDTQTEIYFVDKSVDLDGSIISWAWDFGDGNISNLQNAFHRYGDDGTYVVNLTIEDNDGNTGTVSHEVHVANVPPVVNFSWVPPDPTDMDTILFTDGSYDSDGMVVNWTWDFGDGTTGYGSIITHNYSGNDTYIVTLTARDDDGDSSSLQKEVVVSNEPPVANFSYSPLSPTTADTVHFNDTSADADGTVVNWTWDFGDGNASHGQNPSHSYSDDGTYAVTLTVRDNDNGTANVTKYINISNVAPVAGFSFIPPSPRDVDTVHFSDESYDTDGSVVSWFWEFGDGHNSTLQNPSHTYSDDGSYAVNLTVRDDDGASSVFTKTIEIKNAPPTAEFYYVPPSPDDLDNVSFYDKSGDADGSIVSWKWEFGDGNTSSEKNPSHTYADNGIYTVKLIVTDNDGATDPVLHSVLISNVPPVADFTYSPQNATDLEDITFTDNSTDADGFITNYTWDFGDGNTSYERNATHKYGDNGVYTVTLTVTDNDGSSSSTARSIKILNVKPVAKFSYSPQTPQSGKYVSFDDLSTDADGTIVNGTWDFGDGFTEKDGSLLSHKYDNKGTYIVKLTVTDNDGATSNITHTITVKGKEETSGFDFVMLVAAVGILLFMWRNKKGIWRMR